MSNNVEYVEPLFLVNNLKTKIFSQRIFETPCTCNAYREKKTVKKKWKIGNKRVTMKRHSRRPKRNLWFLHLTTVSTRYSSRFTSVVIKIHRIFSRVWIMNTNVLIIPASWIPKKKKRKKIVSHHDHDKSVYHTNAFKVSCSCNL